MSCSSRVSQHVGILAMDAYFPKQMVPQKDLEVADGVSTGKYTAGLGQKEMGFVAGDREDINSISLTAVASLLEKVRVASPALPFHDDAASTEVLPLPVVVTNLYVCVCHHHADPALSLSQYGIDPMDVGRLEVGTESLIDKSKSTKTVLMDLFPGNSDIEGATVVNACYGGTSALLSAINWVESRSWDGRYAIVVSADIAVYAAGPARPTGGAGAVAMLIGPDAPIVVDTSLKATHASNVWDFFKPVMSSEYPVVDGKHSQTCYYQALDGCYEQIIPKLNAVYRCPVLLSEDKVGHGIAGIDHVVFHQPYHKLVAKSYARLALHDARYCGDDDNLPSFLSPLRRWIKSPLETTYTDRELESECKNSTAKAFAAKVQPSCTMSQRVGNTYTASVFFGLLSLIDDKSSSLEGSNALVFSYGSGALATMYVARFRQPDSCGNHFSVDKIARTVNLQHRLDSRVKSSPADLNTALAARELCHDISPFEPKYGLENLEPGTFYLQRINENWTRSYVRIPKNKSCQNESTTTPSVHLVPLSQQDAVNKRISSYSYESVLISGVSCGLPGQEKVFEDDNLERLLQGPNCIFPISDQKKSALLDKNVVVVEKGKDGMPSTRSAITTSEETIQLGACLGEIDLADYGVSKSISDTMDRAVKVAVAAGLEALRDAGLVKGGSSCKDAWKLEEDFRDTTGIVYATSFPALDAGIGEVMRFLRSRCITRARKKQLVAALRKRLERASYKGVITAEDEESLRILEKSVVTKSSLNLQALEDHEKKGVDDDIYFSGRDYAPSFDDASHPLGLISPSGGTAYEFDRKFLFRVLVLGNAQLAQIIGSRGPNMQTNAACAGSTQALAMAQDMLAVGRCERIVVIAGDDATGDALIPWIGNGFRALGVASIASDATNAALPFNKRRNGMILGSGAIGMVLETEASIAKRFGTLSIQQSIPLKSYSGTKARLLETRISNSAYHGAAMNKEHMTIELERFLQIVWRKHGISREDIVNHGVYFSHETCTNSSPMTSCAYNETYALRECFGPLLVKFIIINTKGFTGHPMGVSFEDVAAVEVLHKGILPPTPNYEGVDPFLGDLRLSMGEKFPARYALHFAAGFGSQIALALYSSVNY